LRLADELHQFKDSGKLIFGICNGFQVLVKSGLLPGWSDSDGATQPATLACNDSGKFEDRWIHLATDPVNCPFLQGIGRLELPMANGEGKVVCGDESVLERLQANGQIVLRYIPAPSGACRSSSAVDDQPKSGAQLSAPTAELSPSSAFERSTPNAQRF